MFGWQGSVNLNAKSSQEQGRKKLIRMMLKLCCGLGAHDIRSEDYVYCSGCCCLQPIFEMRDFANTRSLRKAIENADPGTSRCTDELSLHIHTQYSDSQYQTTPDITSVHSPHSPTQTHDNMGFVFTDRSCGTEHEDCRHPRHSPHIHCGENP